jgi:hypothetical protein
MYIGIIWRNPTKKGKKTDFPKNFPKNFPKKLSKSSRRNLKMRTIVIATMTNGFHTVSIVKQGCPFLAHFWYVFENFGVFRCDSVFLWLFWYTFWIVVPKIGNPEPPRNLTFCQEIQQKP